MSDDVIPSRLSVSRVDDLGALTQAIDLLVLASGFEDRAFKVLSEASLRPDSHCIIVRFVNNVDINQAVFDRYFQEARQHLPENNIHVVTLRDTDLATFTADLNITLARLPREVRAAAIDVSGMPSYAICLVLKIVREHRSRERQVIIYTSAKEYTPTKAEYEQLISEEQEEIALLPRSMAQEMAENLCPDAFRGYRSQAGKSCLVIFAGYEAHRAAGVLDDINPALLLLLYGRPGDAEFDWRLDLSKRLHKRFERGRRAAIETVSTLEVSESLEVLERYYNFLIDDYDLVIAPISSKMDTVAAYLFWERYGEVRLTFPIPISYDPANCPQGASTTYQLVLEPRRTLFKSESGPDKDIISPSER